MECADVPTGSFFPASLMDIFPAHKISLESGEIVLKFPSFISNLKINFWLLQKRAHKILLFIPSFNQKEAEKFLG